MPTNYRGADLLVETLAGQGVERFFSLSGNQIMPIYDACIDADIEIIHVRHEAATVHMADAWGRLTGQPGVALVTAGPGHGNAISAMYTAFMAESPLVLLSGCAPKPKPGRMAFQQIAQAEMAGHVCKASWTASDPTRLGHEMARAFRLAVSGRPGPVHISLPFDVLQANIDRAISLFPQPEDFQPQLSLCDHQTLRETFSFIQQSESPMILAGASLMRDGSQQALVDLEEKIQVPVVGMESPRGVLDPSLGAFAEVLAKADLLVLVGKKLDFTLRFGDEAAIRPDCRFIHIDSEMHVLEQTGELLGDTGRLLLTDLADPQPTVEKMLQFADEFDWSDNDWRQEVRAAISYRPAEWESVKGQTEGTLHPAEICRAAQTFLDGGEDSVLIADGGEFGQWAQACLTAEYRVINGASGSIGSSIPFAIGARCAFPDSRIVTVLGDGTFGFHGMEFDTAVRHNLPFIALVGNDACWNAEHQIQMQNYGSDRLIGCQLNPTRYDSVVVALEGHGEHVVDSAGLEPALQRSLNSGLPACVNVALEGHAAPAISR